MGRTRREEVGAEPDLPADDPETRDVGLLVGYGRGSESLADALSRAGVQTLAMDGLPLTTRELVSLRPDVIFVGAEDTGRDPYHLLPRLREAGISPVILALLQHACRGAVERCLEHGAHDVVCPPHSVSAILTRLRVRRWKEGSGRRERDLSRRVSLGGLTVDLNTRQVLHDSRQFSLSGREFELLVRLMEAGGQVVPREDLLADIWGEAHESDAVLDATVHRLRRKLEDKLSEPGLVTTVRGIGYRLDTATGD